jgi:hypothetical protein
VLEIPKLDLFAVKLLDLSASYPIKHNLFQHSFFFEDPETYNVLYKHQFHGNLKIITIVTFFLLDATE